MSVEARFDEIVLTWLVEESLFEAWNELNCVFGKVCVQIVACERSLAGEISYHILDPLDLLDPLGPLLNLLQTSPEVGSSLRELERLLQSPPSFLFLAQ